MKKRLLVITGVLLLSVFSGSNYAYAVNKLVNTSGISTLSQNTDSQLKFGGTINKIIAYDVDAGPGSDGAFTLDDDVIITGNLDATGFTEGGSTTLSNDISGNAATASDLVCTDCIGTTEIADSYILNTGDAGTGTYSFDTVGIGIAAPDTLLHLYRSDAGINDIVNLLKLERISASKAGAVEVGFGSAIDFYLENDLGTQVEAARIDVVWEDARNTRELSSIRFNQSIAGALTETMRLDDNGQLGISTASPQSLLDVQGPAGTGAAGAGILTLATKELTVVDGDYLGRINFNAPLESDGSDAILTAASIWAEADATFSTTVNSAELVFATGTSEAATEKVRIDSTGNVGIGDTTPDALLDIQSSAAAHNGIIIANTNAGDYDPTISFQLTDGTTLFTMGVDDSAGDAFVIATTGLGTNNRFAIGSSGTVSTGGAISVGGAATIGGDVTATAGNGFKYNNGTTLKNFIYTDPTFVVSRFTNGGDIGTLAGPWTDIDLTSATSATADGVFICLYISDTTASGTAPAWIYAQPNSGVYTDYAEQLQLYSAIATSNNTYWDSMCGMIETGAGQVIEYHVNATGASTAQYGISLLGYTEPTT